MKICNLDYLKSVTPGSNAFVIQIINLFLQDTPVEIEKIKTSLASFNYEEIYKHAHKIKPSLSMVGVPQETFEILLKINEYAKTNTNIEKLKELIPLLESEISKVYIDLKESLAELY